MEKFFWDNVTANCLDVVQEALNRMTPRVASHMANLALKRAAHLGYDAMVAELVSRGATITPECLDLAASRGHLSVLKRILQADGKWRECHTAVTLAVKARHIAVVKFLVEAGVNVANSDCAAFHEAVMSRQLELAAYLAAHHASIFYGDNRTYREAIRLAHLDVICFLHDLGIGLDLVDVNSRAVLDAINHKRLDFVKYFLEKAPITPLAYLMPTLLDKACQENFSDAISYFMDKGFVPNIAQVETLARHNNTDMVALCLVSGIKATAAMVSSAFRCKNQVMLQDLILAGDIEHRDLIQAVCQNRTSFDAGFRILCQAGVDIGVLYQCCYSTKVHEYLDLIRAFRAGQALRIIAAKVYCASYSQLPDPDIIPESVHDLLVETQCRYLLQLKQHPLFVS